MGSGVLGCPGAGWLLSRQGQYGGPRPGGIRFRVGSRGAERECSVQGAKVLLVF